MRALVLAILTVLVVWSIAVAPLAAASPDPSPPAAGGDPRSEGEGPGLVGQPLLAIGIVIGLGLLSATATFAYIRLTDPPGSGRRDD